VPGLAGTPPFDRWLVAAPQIRGDRFAHVGRQRQPILAARPAPAPLPQLAAQRDCPHCGGPVSIFALLTTPEAARPQIPITTPEGVIALRR